MDDFFTLSQLFICTERRVFHPFDDVMSMDICVCVCVCREGGNGACSVQKEDSISSHGLRLKVNGACLSSG